MTKVTIALSTFAKLISSKQEDQIRDLQRYETPGGYDLYRATKSAVHDFIAADENPNEVEA